MNWPMPVRNIFGGLIAAVLGLVLPNTVAAEQGLGVSGSSIVAHAVAAKAIKANDRVTRFDKGLGKVITVFGTKSSKCFRLFFMGNPDRPEAIAMNLRTVCAGGEDLNTHYDAIGRIVGELAPSLEQPADWLLKQRGIVQKKFGNPKGTAWFMQFAAEEWQRYHARVFHLERVLDGKVFAFGGVAPDIVTLAIEAAPRSKSLPAVTYFPYPEDKRLRRARNGFRHGNYRAALSIVQRLSDQGMPDTVAMLGDNYFYRSSKKKENFERAERAYRKSAAAGSAIGQFGLAIMLTSQGPGKNSEARRWMKRAALQGHSLAQIHVARTLFSDKKSPTESKIEAARWCNVSALLGNVLGQNCAGDVSQKGIGVKKDAARAFYWYSVALKRIVGIYNSMRGRLTIKSAALGKILTAAQRRTVEQNAKSWRPMTFEQIKAACGRIQCPKELMR